VLFMSVSVAPGLARQVLAEGWADETPVAFVFDAGAEAERVVRLTLAGLAADAGRGTQDAPGLLVIGEAAAGAWPRDAGALHGARVLLTCSAALLEKAAVRVVDFGGVPLARPLIRLVPEATLPDAAAFDWVVLTSPSAATLFFEAMRRAGTDWRRLPRVMTCGPGSAAAVRAFGIVPDLTPPADYSAQGLAAAARGLDWRGQRVLRLRSELAGPLLADTLRGLGASVTDAVLYRNEPIRYEKLPAFDAVFFASASAAESFVAQFGVAALDGKTVAVIGQPTAAALNRAGRAPDVVAEVATVDGAIEALARRVAMAVHQNSTSER
jgi:uroporphyrinogen-III synthase